MLAKPASRHENAHVFSGSGELPVKPDKKSTRANVCDAPYAKLSSLHGCRPHVRSSRTPCAGPILQRSNGRHTRRASAQGNKAYLRNVVTYGSHYLPACHYLPAAITYGAPVYIYIYIYICIHIYIYIYIYTGAP